MDIDFMGPDFMGPAAVQQRSKLRAPPPSFFSRPKKSDARLGAQRRHLLLLPGLGLPSRAKVTSPPAGLDRSEGEESEGDMGV